MAHLKLTRRRFLQGLGLGVGASLLTPLMHQVWAQNMDGVLPRRFVFFVAGNGIETTTVTSPAMREALLATGVNLQPDARINFSNSYKHDALLELDAPALGDAFALQPLRGEAGEADLTDQAVMLLGISNLVAGGGHSSNFGALSSTLSNKSVPAAATIDKVLSNVPQVRQNTPFDVLRLGIVQRTDVNLHYALLAHDAKKPAPLIVNPSTAYNALFGSIADAAGQQQFAKRSDLLSLTRDDIQDTLSTFPGNSPERAKLEAYLQAVEELEQRQDYLANAKDTLQSVDPGGPDVNPLYSDPCPLVRMEAQCDLATSALLGGLTNVAVIASGANGSSQGMIYESLRSLFQKDPNFRDMVGRHTVCHDSSANPYYQEILHTVTRRHVEMIARMARTLQSVPEGDGTMLDHTAIVFLSDNGDGHHSTAWEWPVLILGGSRIGLETKGRALIYPSYKDTTNNRQMSNVFNTLGHVAGLDLNTFGQEGSTRVAEGPLSALLG